MSNDYYDDDERDLLADMAPASFYATDEQWRIMYAGMNAGEREKLLAGKLTMTAMNLHGLETVPMIVPPELVEELGR